MTRGKAILLTRNGETRTLSGWARKWGYSCSFVCRCLRRGKTPEQMEESSRRRQEESDRDGETLCWSCRRDGRTCPWMNREQPVRGWTAVKTHRESTENGKTTGYDSYRVTACPLFDGEEKCR